MHNNSELYHYGVLGMRWGRRRGTSGSSKDSHKDYSEDYTTARQLKRKSISEMTNKELETLNKRLQLEKQYKELTPTQISKGKKAAGKALKAVKTMNEVYKLIDSPVGKNLRAAMAKKGA